jgi:hypothetical protein
MPFQRRKRDITNRVENCDISIAVTVSNIPRESANQRPSNSFVQTRMVAELKIDINICGGGYLN